MHYMPLLAVACLGLVAAVFAWVTVSAWEQRLFRQEFDNIAGDYASLLQNGVNEYLDKMRAMRAFYDSSHDVDPDEFDRFSNQILAGYGETMRLLWCPRVTRDDVTYREVTIPAGTPLFFPVSIAGRDPTATDDPDRFDPERDSKAHLAFGMGMHICLGQFIARAVIQEGLHLIAQRIRAPQRAGPSGWRPFYGVWGMRGLPISFTPAEAA